MYLKSLGLEEERTKWKREKIMEEFIMYNSNQTIVLKQYFSVWQWVIGC